MLLRGDHTGWRMRLLEVDGRPLAIPCSTEAAAEQRSPECWPHQLSASSFPRADIRKTVGRPPELAFDFGALYSALAGVAQWGEHQPANQKSSFSPMITREILLVYSVLTSQRAVMPVLTNFNRTDVPTAYGAI